MFRQSNETCSVWPFKRTYLGIILGCLDAWRVTVPGRTIICPKRNHDGSPCIPAASQVPACVELSPSRRPIHRGCPSDAEIKLAVCASKREPEEDANTRLGAGLRLKTRLSTKLMPVSSLRSPAKCFAKLSSSSR
ncbi:uncharacterized protein LOC112351219 [Selaginella moellendorffii]|uniref:uncharacterized protein LOC112342711 n=1 Tax=Selaginella moellendorffii TaxID=88036 RepID=UPI000D1D09AF|nr:uncharacterized protein LOC112342711 [Selaginella moellendorffii]XP_024544446.1 uncharacterized protein LOC112351219 [Selaginella moellendorffii]|eukprot:XP_024520705.1 uncharacterized protein LOC112342711 [Selaginella moellendorffii]